MPCDKSTTGHHEWADLQCLFCGMPKSGDAVFKEQIEVIDKMLDKSDENLVSIIELFKRIRETTERIKND